MLPLIVALGAEELIPTSSHPANRDFGMFLGSDAGHVFMHGAWGWFGLILVEMIFNTVLGEELLFRGFLLPRMNGAFGDRDWIANGVLFAGYHLHEPWVISDRAGRHVRHRRPDQALPQRLDRHRRAQRADRALRRPAAHARA